MRILDVTIVFTYSHLTTAFDQRVLNSISRYRFKHEKINFISTSGHVIICLLYKHTNNDVFDDFPKIATTFRRLPKIFQNCSEGLTTFPNIFRRLPKIAEEGPMMFRSYSNTSEYFFRDNVAIMQWQS